MLTPPDAEPLQRGQGLVEFAIVAPLFLILIFAIVEGALVMNAQALLDNATREGARGAALCGGSTSSYTYRGAGATGGGLLGSPCPSVAEQTVKRNLGVLAITRNPDNPYVLTTANGTCPYLYCAPQGSVLTVSVSYQYSFLVSNFLGGNPTIQLTSVAHSISEQ